MSRAIIVLNAGSSSLRFSIHQIVNDDPSLRSHGQFDGLGTSPCFKARDRNRSVLVDEELESPSGGTGHAEAIAHLLEWVHEEFGRVLSPAAIGHRIAHGGLEFVEPASAHAGSHQSIGPARHARAAASAGQPGRGEGGGNIRPDLPQVGCFDTAFHRGRAKVTERFGLSHDLWLEGVRRWGFYGLACTSALDQSARRLRSWPPGG